MKTEKEMLQLASMSAKERKLHIKQKLPIPDEAGIKDFKHGTIIHLTHLGQNGSITLTKYSPTLTTGCRIGVIVKEQQ